MSTKGFQEILQNCDPLAVGCNNLQGEDEGVGERERKTESVQRGRRWATAKGEMFGARRPCGIQAALHSTVGMHGVRLFF